MVSIENKFQVQKLKNWKFVRTKHIEKLIGEHFLKDNFNSGLVVTVHFPTGLQLVNIFTKGLPHGRFQDLVRNLRMIDILLPTWGRML